MVHEKLIHTKGNYRNSRGLDSFQILRGVLAKKRGGVLGGGVDTPMYTISVNE